MVPVVVLTAAVIATASAYVSRDDCWMVMPANHSTARLCGRVSFLSDAHGGLFDPHVIECESRRDCRVDKPWVRGAAFDCDTEPCAGCGIHASTCRARHDRADSLHDVTVAALLSVITALVVAIIELTRWLRSPVAMGDSSKIM